MRSIIVNMKIAISGATGGLGNEIVFALAEKKHELIFVDRNRKKSEDLAARVKNAYPETKISFVTCDLADMKSVKAAAEEIKESGVETLILNAGVYNVPVYKCDTGYNNVFQINFISQYYLARYLSENCPSLEKVVAMSSIAHDYGKLDESDVDYSTRKKSSKIYGNSKRFLTFALFGYFNAVSRVRLAIAHPGVTLTNMTNHYPKAINWLVKIGIKLIFPSPKKAIRSVIKAIDEDCAENEWIGPTVFRVWGKPEKRPIGTCSKEESRAICRLTEEIYQKL